VATLSCKLKKDQLTSWPTAVCANGSRVFVSLLHQNLILIFERDTWKPATLFATGPKFVFNAHVGPHGMCMRNNRLYSSKLYYGVKHVSCVKKNYQFKTKLIFMLRSPRVYTFRLLSVTARPHVRRWFQYCQALSAVLELDLHFVISRFFSMVRRFV